MNNPRDTEKYTETLKSVKLSDSSRARIEKELSDYLDFHTADMSARKVEESRSSMHTSPIAFWNTGFFTHLTRHSMPFLALAIVLVVSGGTTFIAENSQPGDALYSVKTSVNDPLRNAFTFSNEADVDVEADILAEPAQEEREENVEGAPKHSSTRIASDPQTENSRPPANDESSAIMSMDSSMTTSLALEPIPVSTLVTNTEARIASLREVLEKHQEEIETEVYAELSATLDESELVLMKVMVQSNEDLAREVAYEASDLAGEVESAISLLGTVTIDPETGAIIDIDFENPPPTEPDRSSESSQGTADGEVNLELDTGVNLPEELPISGGIN